MKEGGSVDPWKGEDEVLKMGEHIPGEKHDLLPFLPFHSILTIADSKSATSPEEHLQLYSR